MTLVPDYERLAGPSPLCRAQPLYTVHYITLELFRVARTRLLNQNHYCTRCAELETENSYSNDREKR